MRYPPAFVLTLGLAAAALASPPQGYYRQPSLRGDTIVFVAEGDLWKVSTSGGVATRLTSHPADESTPQISPDGTSVAFTGQYEGPAEVYTMPLAGGVPTRLTYDATRTSVVGWRGGQIIASTLRYSTLPDTQLVLIDSKTGAKELIPLSQASDGAFAEDGRTFVFTRLPFQGSQTKRYRGGFIQQLWKFTLAGEGEKADEAIPLTSDFTGTSTAPMWWRGRIYFISDRDGTMEIWSMTPDGKDLKQHTSHQPPIELLDVKGPSLDNGRIVYQLGADLWLYDIAKNTDTRLDITLDSDFDQMREHWIKKPIDYLTSFHISPEGDHVVLTARGQVFVAPRNQGRFVEAGRKQGVRYRDARFMPDGKTILALSDETGEVEFWTLPADGVGTASQLTTGSRVLRWEGVPSPDGKLIAHHDKDLRLFVFNVETKEDKQIDEGKYDYPGFQDLAWSRDSRWLAYATAADNQNLVVKLYDASSEVLTALTTDRFVSYAPAWSADGKWIYLLSDRAISTTVGSPWGFMAPEPHYEKVTKLYEIALKPGTRSPFAPDDELRPKEKEKEKKEEKPKPEPKPEEKPEVQPAEKTPPHPAPPPPEKPVQPDKPKPPEPQKQPEPRADGAQPEGAKHDEPPKDDKAPDTKDEKPKAEPVEIVLGGIAARLREVPIPNGDYGSLSAGEKRLFFTARDDDKTNLMTLEITNKEPQAKVLAPDVRGYELSGDRKAIVVRKGDGFYVIDASAGPPASLDKAQVNLGGWTFSIDPREEWRQMFVESWRLMRDYFYDTNMHNVDWKSMLERYLPLVDRVSTRGELSDLISQMVGEVSALHHFVYGGDLRDGPDKINPASLGAILRNDQAAGGAVIEHIFQNDPDYPQLAAPLHRPGVDAQDGDVIVSINGVSPLSVLDPAVLLRAQAGRQVLIELRPKGEPKDTGETRRAIVTPISTGEEGELRYHEWEYTRRLAVERAGGGRIGYLHLRAMGGGNFDEFALGFYPVYNRAGLIIDVRHNRGGSIDSWILSRLLRKEWFFWQGRAGLPTWNMQYAFRGHVAVLCDQRTASDGEAFTEGFERLKLGKVFGMRTWGGEIWLSSSNFLVDRGIATAAEYGVYGPEGVWLIEGHGAEPDAAVDNLPHATFEGHDAQLEAAISYLNQKIKDEPVDVPPAPKRPDKRFPLRER